MIDDKIITDNNIILRCRESEVKDALELSFSLINSTSNDSFSREINNEISIVEDQLENIDNEIERLTVHSEGIDYVMAVVCGITTGLIDSFVIGEFDYQETIDKVSQKFNDAVIEKTQKLRADDAIQRKIKKAEQTLGRKLSTIEKEKYSSEIVNNIKESFNSSLVKDKETGINATLKRCIAKIEEIYKIPSDNAFQGIKGMNSLTHHLDDWAHHPTPLGLTAAILCEIFKIGFFTDKNGHWHIPSLVKSNDRDKLKTKLYRILGCVVLAGVISWIIKLATNDKLKFKKHNKIVNKLLTYMSIPAVLTLLPKVYSAVIDWRGHLMSDMAGSKNSPGEGMGIPGFFLSLLKELSSIFPLNLTPLPKIITTCYADNRFDMRKEIALIKEIGKQSIPVLIGDIMVRSFYFIKQLVSCFSNFQEGTSCDWRKTIPVGNRTVERMILIESATFTSCDVLDAVIRSLVQNGGNIKNPKLYADMALRINFVGIGKLTVSTFIDLKMANDKRMCDFNKMNFNNKLGFLLSAQTYDKQTKMWISSAKANNALVHMRENATKAVVFYINTMNRLSDSMEDIYSSSHILFDNEEEKCKLLEIFD